mmetsp:Transcript_14088/g.46000  ORF Transcript_14088/g.46000 Transcript_14088/m.46000 type:complete len:202 (-) Transcript_14088:256-861(-)
MLLRSWVLFAASAGAFVVNSPVPARPEALFERLRTGTIMDEFKARELAKLDMDRYPFFQPGDSVVVDCEIKEGTTTRIQQFAGVVIKRSGRDLSKSFTVRKIAAGGIGCERTFPLIAPFVKKVQVTRRGSVRRAKLYYLRKLTGKSARIKDKVRGLNYVKRVEEDRIKRRDDAIKAKAEAAKAEAEAAAEAGDGDAAEAAA